MIYEKLLGHNCGHCARPVRWLRAATPSRRTHIESGSEAGREERCACIQARPRATSGRHSQAACARLAAAHSMSFTAVVSYESPSRLGPPLVYSTRSEVTMQRPDKFKVITLGDGPPSDFYYDGKTMTAFAPVEKLVAVADAPPTIDAALQAAFVSGAIYFPFSDVIVADPYKDIADGLTTAFYIGQSNVVGGTTTDMVAYVTGGCVHPDMDRRRRQASPPHLRHLPQRSRATASRTGIVELAVGYRCTG